MTKPKIILVALAPFYDGTVLWVEQLFDFLNLFTTETILLPHVTLNEKIFVEDNAILSLIDEVYPDVVYYRANANIQSVESYLQAREQAFEKIKSYFTFVENRVMLEQFNDKLYWALARQYEMLLSDEFGPTFHDLQQGLIVSLDEKLKTIQHDALVIVPIEHAAIFQEYLATMFDTPIFIYGEDFLDIEK